MLLTLLIDNKRAYTLRIAKREPFTRLKHTEHRGNGIGGGGIVGHHTG